MRQFVLSSIFSFLSLLSYCWATHIEPDVHWGEMFYYAKSRTEWFQTNCQTLSNNKIDLSERLSLAKKINPTLIESNVWVNTSLKKESQHWLQSKKLVDGVLADMTYGYLSWHFIAQTLEFYCTAPNNSDEQRKAVLPHLVKELINFDSFALGDLTKHSQAETFNDDEGSNEDGYFEEEFFIGRTILEECDILAQHYAIEVDRPPQARKEITPEPFISWEMRESTGKGYSTTHSTELSTASPYFMEQLFSYRKFRSDYSAQKVPMPDLKSDPKLKIFQAYILPASGSSLIEELQKKTVIEEVKPEKKKEKKEKKSKPQKNEPSKPANKNKHNKALQPKQPAEKPPVPQLKDLPGQSSSEEEEIRESSSVLNPVLLSEQVIVPAQRFNIRDIRLNIEQGDSRRYTFKGEVYSLPFIEQSLKYYNLPFLWKIKQLIYLSPKTDKLPNLAQGCLTLHFQAGDREVHKTVVFDELFLNGGKYFEKNDIGFKDQHHIVTAMQDFLTDVDRRNIDVLSSNQKGIPLGIAMEKKLRSQVAGGAWRSNCLDSEALFLLHLTKKLPHILSGLSGEYPDQTITILAAVIGVSSYRDCCSSCEKLLQGFQWNLIDTILKSKPQGVRIDSNFATLTITLGHVRLEKRFAHTISRVFSGHGTLEAQKHKLIRTQSE